MKITGAIFDFDGTVFDSMDIWRDIGMKYLRHIGLEAGADMADSFFNMATRKAIADAKVKYSLEETEEELASGLNDFLKMRYFAEGKPKNDILDFLGRLKGKGVKMCIATASDRKPVSAALEKYGMLDYFSEIFCVSSVGVGKGKPDIFRTAHSFLGTEKSTTWVFEDAYYAAKTAKSDGFPVVGVYDKTEPLSEELKNLADIYIRKYSEIPI